MKISIITPVYNVSKHLPECIASVLNQTYQNYELILIDDYSTDDSRKVMQEFSDQDSRIKAIYNEKNMGVAKTRNKGIQLAVGEYIYFLDSDDFLTPDALSLMANEISINSVDVLLVDAYKTGSCGTEYYHNLFKGSDMNNFTGHAAWWLLIKSEILSSNEHVRFVDGAHPGEDTVFTFKVFSEAKTFARLRRPVIFYRQHEASVMSKILIDKCKLTNSSILCLDALDEYVGQMPSKRSGAFKNIKYYFYSSINLGCLNLNEKYHRVLFKKVLYSKVCKFIFYKKITNKNRFLIKVFKIPVYNFPLKD